MTTHPVPAVDDVDQPLIAASVDGDPHDRPMPAPHNRPFPPYAFTPALPQRNPGATLERQAAIDAIYALGAFFEQHPEVPAPWLIRAHSSVEHHADLVEVARVLDRPIYGERVAQLDAMIGSAQLVVSDRHPERPL